MTTPSKASSVCQHCGAVVHQRQSAINRAMREGKSLYCDRVCAGLARRVSLDQKKEAKRLYDAKRRTEKAVELSAQHAEYFRRTYDPAKARESRRASMGRHVEYCRRPEYRAYKAEYDQEYCARKYGEYAEAYRLLLDLEREIRSRASSYERRRARAATTHVQPNKGGENYGKQHWQGSDGHQPQRHSMDHNE